MSFYYGRLYSSSITCLKNYDKISYKYTGVVVNFMNKYRSKDNNNEAINSNSNIPKLKCGGRKMRQKRQFSASVALLKKH